MSMYFRRANSLAPKLHKIAQKKRRRPYDTVTNIIPNTDNELVDKKPTENDGNTSPTRVKEEPPDGSDGSDVKPVINEIKIKTEPATTNNRRAKPSNRPKLSDILQKLIDRVPSISTANSTNATNAANHLVANNARIDFNNHQHMSPRKRILRELEQVSLDEFESTKKKPRCKTANNHSAAIEEPVTNSSATTNSHSSICNGNGKETTIPTTQAVPRPVSSYSITSLLGHNNNNNSIKNDSGANNNKGSPVQFHQTPQKSSASSAFSTRKKSPSYNPNNSIKTPSRNATPSSLQNNFNRSPSTSSPINYGRNNHSPDLSPSPEQTYARYRPYNVQYPPPPSSGGFHPYMSVSSRGSLSPPYSTDSALFLSNLSTRSPSQPYATSGTSSSAQESSSPLPYARYSPSGYAQISPQQQQQHFSSNKTSMYSAASSTNSNSTNKSKVATSTSIKKKTELGHEAIIGGGGRTVPAKNPAHRQQYGSPVSTVNSETKTNELFYKPMSSNESNSKKDSNADRSGGSGAMKSLVSVAGPASSPEVVANQHYDKDYQQLNANSNNSSVLSRLDIESNALRSNHAQAAYQQNMMYMFPPPHHSAVGIAPPPPGSYIPPPPVYYHSLAVAGFYRDWMHYASAPPSRLSNPLLASYANMHQNPPMTANGPWGSVPNNNQPADNILSFRMKQDETNSGKCFFFVPHHCAVIPLSFKLFLSSFPTIFANTSSKLNFFFGFPILLLYQNVLANVPLNVWFRE